MLRDNRLGALGALWGVLAVPLLGLFFLALPAVYARKLTPLPNVAAGLDQLGLPVTVYAASWTVTLVAFGLLCFGTAAVIVWRRPRETMAWFVALFLVTLGAVNAPLVEALVWQRPGLEWAATLGFQLLLTSLVLFLFTFPDGRFHPRRSWLVVIVTTVGFVVARGSVANPVTTALFFALLVGLAVGVAAQVHRYLHVSDPTQRQQTRWVLAATSLAIATQLLFPVLEQVPAVSRPGVGAALHDLGSVVGISAGFGALVVAVAVAVLRQRLWTLDTIINRALVYGGLTVLLLVLYVGVVTVLGRSIGAPGNASGSLLAAALVALAFAPLRHRLQRAINRLMYGQREEPYQVLSQLGQRLEASVAPTAVLQTIASTVAVALKSPYVAVQIDGKVAHEATADRPAWVGDRMVRLSLLHQHESVGELQVAPRGPQEDFSPADRALLHDLARQSGAAVYAVRVTEQLRRSRERLVTAREEERRRLRRDLHDGLGPALASMSLQAETAGELVTSDPQVARSILADLVDQLQASTAEVRRLVYDLRPAALDDLGLGEALRAFLARADAARVVWEFRFPDPLPELSAAVELAVFRIVQEAVTNVLRHAAATACLVIVEVRDTVVTIEVNDNGIGLPDGTTAGVGLRSMRARATELGGTCDIARLPDGGTQVRVRLPRHTPATAP